MTMRDRILSAAARVYTEAGFRGTTTRRVAQEAGVNEITLFRHFGNKEGLIKAALEDSSRVSQNPLNEPKDPERELSAWAINTYRHWYNGRNLIARVLGDLTEHPELAPGICKEPGCEHAALSRYLGRMRELGLAKDDFEPDAAAGLLLGAIFTHSLWRDHFEDDTLPPSEVVMDAYVRLLLSSIGAAVSPAKPLPAVESAAPRARSRRHA